MKFLLPTCILLGALYACNSSNREPQTAQDSTLVAYYDTLTGVSSEEDELETFNNEDYGDPGLAGLIIDSANIAPEVKAFLSHLMHHSLDSVIESGKDILLLEPGPGVSPTYGFMRSAPDLLAVNEVVLFQSDSSVILTMTFYRLVHDVCQVLEEFPEGIYIRDVDFNDLAFSDPDEIVNQKLQTFTKDIKGERGIEMIMKFRTRTDYVLFLHVFAIKRDDKLFLRIIDQRECGA